MDKDHVRRRQAGGKSRQSAGIEPQRSSQSALAKQGSPTARYVLRPARAERVIQFIERFLRTPSGIGAGTFIKLRPFQREFIHDVYSPHDKTTELRCVRRAILSMGRKNGKTALIACLALAHLTGPEQVRNGEIYSAATDREQAAQVFKVARQMVEASPELSQKLKIIPSTKTIACYSNGSFYRAISAEAGTKHGYNPTVVIYDELAQAKSRDLYDVLDTSFGARAEPLFITISTQNNDPEHILSQLIDDGLNGNDHTIVCHLYSAEDDCELDDETQWKRANPALDDFRDLNDLRGAISKAIRLPSEEPKVRNLFLNQRVAPIASLISRPEWMACKSDNVTFEKGERIYLALDLSSTIDLTALVMGSAEEPTKIKSIFWKPQDHLADHSNRDFGSGNQRYAEWAAAGHLLASPGKSINPNDVALYVAKLHQDYKVVGLAYDRWRIEDLLREFDRIGLQAYKEGDKGSGLRLVPWGQGFRDMAPAIDALELAVVERKLIHSSNPILNWNMANALAAVDPSGNRKIAKDKVRFRIDGAVALAMLMGLKARDRQAPPVDVSTMIAMI